MSNNLQTKVAFITGGGSGIGKAASLAFFKAGATVALTDINVANGQAVAEEIKQAGGEALFIEADVTQADEVRAAIEKCIQTYGQIDCALNNAGIVSPQGHPIADYPEDEWDRVININLKGVFLCLKYELQQMQKQQRGAIVNVASIYGLVGDNMGHASYIASKHGVVGLTKAAALESAAAGIRVNAVCPGYIKTPLIAGALEDPDVQAYLESRHPIGRLGTPDEVANAVIWLCSEESSFVTGHALSVDGGFVTQ